MATNPRFSQAPISIYEAERALSFVDTSDRDLWIKMGAALKSEFGEEGKNTWLNWSQQDQSFNLKDANATWKSIKPGYITIGSLIYEAKRYGYQPEQSNERPRLSTQELAKREAERKIAEQQAIIERMNEAQEAKEKAQALYARGHAANPKHPYLVSKGIIDPDILKSIKQLGKNLLIPAYQNRELVAVQKINPDGGKYFGKGEQLSGSSLFIGRWLVAQQKGLLMAEGFATAASLHKATGQPVMVTFNAHNMVAMAERLKEQEIDITLCADNDSHKKGTGLTYAQKAAEILGERAKVVMPEFTQEDIANYQAKHGAGKYPTDFNDLHELRGLQAVAATLNHEIAPTLHTPPQSPNQGATTMTPDNTTPTQEAPAQQTPQPQQAPQPTPAEPTPPTPEPQMTTPPQVEEEENGILFDFERSLVRAPQEQEPIAEKQDTPTQEAPAQEAPYNPFPKAVNDDTIPRNQADFIDQKYVLDHNYRRPPEGLEDRYYASGDYYFDAKTNTSIFMDKGSKLTTAKSDMQTVHDMIEVAKAKGWDNIKLSGSKEFKRLAFLEAESQGISTTNYTPTKEDLAILEHLHNSRAVNRIESTAVQMRTVPLQPAPIQTPVKEVPAQEVPAQEAPAQEIPPLVLTPEGEQKLVEFISQHAKDGVYPDDIKNDVLDTLEAKMLNNEPLEYEMHWSQTKSGVSEKIVINETDLDIGLEQGANNASSLMYAADQEASRLVANNKIPTVGQIEESVVADTDEFVSNQEIGGAEIDPDVLAMANRLRDAGKHLNPQDMETLKQHVKVAIVITHGMQGEFKAHALRNFEENISKSIQGDKLNIANPLKPTSQEKSQSREMRQEKAPAMAM